MDSLDRCMAALLGEEVEVHATGLRALGPNNRQADVNRRFEHGAVGGSLGGLMQEI
jgi:hypothetical protein